MRKFILKLFTVLILFLSTSLSAQDNIKFSVGGGIGVGSMFGNFLSQTTFASNIFAETNLTFSPFNKTKIEFIYSKKIEKVLPGNYNYDYYAQLISIVISEVFSHQLNEVIFMEEALGISMVNDRSFNDIDTWNFGIQLSGQVGIPVSQNFDAIANASYGITLNNTTINYFHILACIRYHIN